MSAALTRRTMLTVLAATGAGACAGCGGRPDTNDDGSPSDPDPAPLASVQSDDAATAPATAGDCTSGQDVGAVTDFPDVGGFYALKAQRLIVGRAVDGQGRDALFAMTLLCSHARCPVQQHSNYWYCRCHGARFDYDGTARSSVAPRSLRNFPLAICGGRVLVDFGSSVPLGTLTPVPA